MTQLVHLHQIGDLPVHFHLKPDAYTIADRGKTTQLWHSPNVVRPNFSFAPKLKTLSIEGTVEPICWLSPEATIEHLRALVGFETDFIGYQLTGCCNGAGKCCSCCGCSTSSGNCEPIWLHTRGVVKSVTPAQPSVDRKITVKIKLELNTYWRALNPLTWEYANNKIDPLRQPIDTPDDLRKLINPIPTCDMIYPKCQCMIWRKLIYDNRLLLYEDVVWGALCDGFRIQYPPILRNISWGKEHTIHNLFIDPDLWSAPPLSIYQFNRVGNASEILIDVYRPRVWEGERSIVRIDVTQLNVNLVTEGHAPLTANDRMVIGDVRPRFGFIILEDGTVIDDVNIPMTFTGYFPGMLTPGRNTVQIFGDGAWHRQTHLFRRM